MLLLLLLLLLARRVHQRGAGAVPVPMPAAAQLRTGCCRLAACLLSLMIICTPGSCYCVLCVVNGACSFASWQLTAYRRHARSWRKQHTIPLKCRPCTPSQEPTLSAEPTCPTSCCPHRNPKISALTTITSCCPYKAGGCQVREGSVGPSIRKPKEVGKSNWCGELSRCTRGISVAARKDSLSSSCEHHPQGNRSPSWRTQAVSLSQSSLSSPPGAGTH